MRAIPALSLFIPIYLGLSNVHALKIPFAVYPRGPLGFANDFRSLQKLSFAFDEPLSETIDNKRDIRYATNITINGKQVSVAIDTGSTDLWVNPPGGIGQFNDTGIPIQLRYGDGSYGANGTIGVSPFKFSSYEVLRQAFLHVTRSTIKGLDVYGIYGILGLSFDFGTASRINAAIKNRYGNSSTWGQSVLHNIFDQHPDQPNFVALSLSRTEDLEDTQGGSFSIGEYHPNYTAVAREPQLPQFPEGGTRWTALLEGILVGERTVPVASTIRNVPAGRGVALLDTGDPQAMFPTSVWDGIYSAIPHSAKFSETDGSIWILPCNTTTLVELVFGGKKYPIHPLDLSIISDPFIIDGQNVVACVSAFRGLNGFAAQGFEYSLGDSFLRNVYSVYNFGNSTGKPYMQLLSRINPQKAVSQVTSIRGKTMANLPQELPPATLVRLLHGSSPSATSVDPTSPTSTGNGSANAVSGWDTSFNVGGIDGESLKKYGMLALVLLAMNVLVCLALLVFAVLNCMRRGSDKRSGRAFVGGAASTQYVPVKLEDDALPGYQKRYSE